MEIPPALPGSAPQNPGGEPYSLVEGLRFVLLPGAPGVGALLLTHISINLNYLVEMNATGNGEVSVNLNS